MECSCEISVDLDCTAEAFKRSTPKARKEHICTECRRVIKKDEDE